MSRSHLVFNSLVLCAALGASSFFGSGCSSSDATDTPSAAGKAATAGRSNSSAGSETTSDAGASPVVDSAGTGGDGGDDTGSGTTAGSGPGRGGDGDAGATPAAGGSDAVAGGSSVAGGGSVAGSDAVAGGSSVAGSGNDAAIAHGLQLTMTQGCTTCHQADYSGYAIYPNITPDMDTGIGSWSDDEIKAAITGGQGKDGGTLCNLMLRFPFSESEVADVITYLHSLPAVSNTIDEACPGHINP